MRIPRDTDEHQPCTGGYRRSARGGRGGRTSLARCDRKLLVADRARGVDGKTAGDTLVDTQWPTPTVLRDTEFSRRVPGEAGTRTALAGRDRTRRCATI